MVNQNGPRVAATGAGGWFGTPTLQRLYDWWWQFLAGWVPVGCSFPTKPLAFPVLLLSLLQPLLCSLGDGSKPLQDVVRLKTGRQISCSPGLKSYSLVKIYRKCKKRRCLAARAALPASRAAHHFLQRKQQQCRWKHPTDQLTQVKTCTEPAAPAGNLSGFRGTLCPGRMDKGHLTDTSPPLSVGPRTLQTPREDGGLRCSAEATIWRQIRTKADTLLPSRAAFTASKIPSCKQTKNLHHGNITNYYKNQKESLAIPPRAWSCITTFILRIVTSGLVHMRHSPLQPFSAGE